MQHYLLRESVFTHFCVAFGVLLLTAALLISPRGKTLAWAAPAPAETPVVVQVVPAAMQSNAVDQTLIRDYTNETSRGSSNGERTAATATPVVAATAAPSPAPTGVPPAATAVQTQPAPASTQARAQPPALKSVAPPPTAAPAPAYPQFHVGIQAGHWQ